MFDERNFAKSLQGSESRASTQIKTNQVAVVEPGRQPISLEAELELLQLTEDRNEEVTVKRSVKEQPA